MSIITKISTQKKATDRYNIYLDEKYAFAVDQEVFIRYQLKKGKKLTELEITQIQYEDEIRKAFNSAIQYLSFRMRSENEIRTQLRKKEWEDPVIEAVILKLHERNYIDDLEFAKAYVCTQVNGGKKGPNLIKRELNQKGIHQKDLEDALLQYRKEEQIDHAIQLGDKIARQDKKMSERFLKQKIEQYLMTRGFPFDIISIAIEEIEYEKEDDEQWQSLVKQAERAERRNKKYSGYEYKQRMKQALFRHGFPIDLIERYLTEKENETE